MATERLNRINELAKKSKTVGLSEEEKAEQAVLRREYLDALKANIVMQLDNTFFVDEDGNETKISKK